MGLNAAYHQGSRRVAHSNPDRFIKEFLALGADCSPEELTELFHNLDLDHSGRLDVEELSKMLSMAAAPTSVIAAQAAKKIESEFVKTVNKLKAKAEESQKEAHAALAHANAQAEAAEAAVKAAADAKLSAGAKAKADELAARKVKRAPTMASFMVKKE